MKKTKKYLSAFFLVFCSFLLNAEQPGKTEANKTIDSLLTVLKQSKEDTAQINILNALSLNCLNTGLYEQSMQYAEQAQSHGEKSGYKKGIEVTYNNIAAIYRMQGNYDKSLNYLEKALIIQKEIGNKKEIAVSTNNIGTIYFRKGNYEKSMALFLKYLKYCEDTGDKAGIAASYNNIGTIYLFQEKYQNGLDNYLKSLKFSTEIGDKKDMAASFSKIGDIYFDQQQYEKSLESQQKSLKINKEIRDKLGTAVCFADIGLVYEKQKNFKEAAYYLNEALIIYKQKRDKHHIKKLYLTLSALNDEKGDYKQAYEYHKLFSALNDSIIDEQSGRQIAEMDAKYESQKKEKDIELLTKDKALQQADINKQKLIRNGFMGGLALALLLAFLLLSRYRTKQKLNTVLSTSNNELTQKNTLIEKQKEKIIDSINYAQLIQQSILMEESEIQKQLPDSFVFYQPKDIVSGDFYWFSHVNDKIIIAAADCTGHGVPGAFMSMIGNTLLNQIVNEKQITKPSEILRLLHLEIIKSLHQGKDGILSRDGMDIALCSIDYKNNQLEYAGALNPLYMVSDNEFTIIKADWQTIGSAGMKSKNEDPLKREYTNHSIPIKNSASIYLFTDGYMDQFGGIEKKKFGTQKLKELLLNNQQLSMKEQKNLIAATHENWKGNTQQIDDILVIGFKL